MTNEQIRRTIIDAILTIAPDVEEDQILPDRNIQRSLEIDSFDFLKILTMLDEKLGVSVPESDYRRVDTLEHMEAYFLERIGR